MIEAAYVAFAAALAVLVLYGRPWGMYWHWRSAAWRTIALAVGVFVIVIAGWFVLNSGLSRPLPAGRALFQDRDRSGELLWLGELPPDVFHLLVRWPGEFEPRYYSIPWSDDLSAQLEAAMQGLVEGEHIGVSPFRLDGDDADLPPVFHPLPQPADPLKISPLELPQQES